MRADGNSRVSQSKTGILPRNWAMDTFFLVILGFLALLAAIDLFVGVSNDASNFLNSAVGCRIAPYKVLVAVAGLGILLGATFSGGMMEIAKKGVLIRECSRSRT